MNYTIPLLISGLFTLHATNEVDFQQKPESLSNIAKAENAPSKLNFQQGGRISAVEFKNQNYCRAELEDFDFDAKFSVVSATVYFTGANFPTPKTGYIYSNDLKTIKDLKEKCTVGSIIIFDDIKVIGPDNITRTILGVTYKLY